MDLQQTYDYLERISKVDYAIQRKKLRRDELHRCLLPGGIRYDMDRVQVSHMDRFAEIIADIDVLSRQIETLRCEKAQLITEIGDAIECLPSESEKTVLSGFYIGRMHMNDIAEMIHYSPRRAYEFRKSGVRHLAELLSANEIPQTFQNDL